MDRRQPARGSHLQETGLGPWEGGWRTVWKHQYRAGGPRHTCRVAESRATPVRAGCEPPGEARAVGLCGSCVVGPWPTGPHSPGSPEATWVLPREPSASPNTDGHQPCDNGYAATPGAGPAHVFPHGSPEPVWGTNSPAQSPHAGPHGRHCTHSPRWSRVSKSLGASPADPSAGYLGGRGTRAGQLGQRGCFCEMFLLCRENVFQEYLNLMQNLVNWLI